MCSAVQSGWSSRLVTKYGGPPPIDRPSLSISLSTLPGIPHVAEIDRRALENGNQERAEHADEVPDRCGRQLPAAVGRVVRQQLAGLEAERLMAVDDALRVARRARGERDQRRARRIGGDGADQRLIGEQVVEAVHMLLARAFVGPDQTHDRDVRAQVRLVVHPAEFLGGDEHLRPRGGDDVAQFLAAVEVHDRHHDRTEERRRPERRRPPPPSSAAGSPPRRRARHRVRADRRQVDGLATRRRRRCPRRAARPSAPRSRCPGSPAVRRR